MLDRVSKIYLARWANNLKGCNARPMLAENSDLTIYSDALITGCGGLLNGVATRGPWKKTDKQRHTNELELLAALYSLKSFTSHLKGNYEKKKNSKRDSSLLLSILF